MTIITSAFQGILNIPLYKTPYTVAPPAGYPNSLSSGAAINKYSDTPAIFQDQWYIRTQANAPMEIVGGGCVALRYSGTNKFTVNNGFGAVAGATSNALNFSYWSSVMNFGDAWTVADPNNINDWYNYSAVSLSAFYNDRQVGTIQIPYNGNVNYSHLALQPFGSLFQSQRNVMPAVQNTSGLVGVTRGIQSFLTTPYTTTGGHVFMVNTVPAFVSGPATAPPQYGDSTLTGPNFAGGTWNFADYINSVNMLYGLDNSTNINWVKWNNPFAWPPLIASMNIMNSGTLVFDANSNLNAQITKYHAAQVVSPLGGRGMLATDIDAGIDYFVSPDGTRYWQIQYFPQGNTAISKPSAQEAANKFVDSRGTFWYTGSATQGGGVIQPLYSFGPNSPYNFYKLVQQPFHMPCFDPCLGAGQAFTKIPTN